MDEIKNSIAYKMYVPQILTAAKSLASVDEWAERIMGTVPEAYDGVLVDIVSRPDVVEYLATFEPEVKNSVEWFTKLTEKIKEAFVDGEEGEGEGAEPTDVPETAKNGKVPSVVGLEK